MARKFTEAGLESVALTGDDPPDVRAQRLARLQAGRLRCVFSVEVLGEGVDVPDVDCLLLLRPTASATVFAQQLGRGLRRAAGKSHLTVIDLIGQHRREFRFEDRLARDRRHADADRSSSRSSADFPFLPAGCTVDLDRQSREIVLDNLKAAVRRSRWATLVSRSATRAGRDHACSSSSSRRDHRLEDVYRAIAAGPSFDATRTTRRPRRATRNSRRRSLRALGRLTHVDDPERVAFYRELLSAAAPPRDEPLRRAAAAAADDARVGAWLRRSGSGVARRVLRGSLARGGGPRRAARAARRSRRALADPGARRRFCRPRSRSRFTRATRGRRSSRRSASATGVKPKVTQGGILWVPQAKSDVFFVDLHKAERDYSPTTMYRDYAINRELFHWESQSRQTPRQPTVQRYINHQARGTRVLLFVRERKTFELGTQPFTFLGPATYVEHRGERPVAFTWRLPSTDARRAVRGRAQRRGSLTSVRRGDRPGVRLAPPGIHEPAAHQRGVSPLGREP